MATFSAIEWLVLLSLGAGCALGLMHIVAIRLRNDREMADLVDRARELRRHQEERIAAMRARADDEADGEDVLVVGETVEEAVEVPETPEQRLAA